MGNMKTWWIFGFERWGGLRPAWCIGDGKKYFPFVLGLWIRGRK